MTARESLYEEALDRAATHARAWLSSIPDRPVGPRATAAEVAQLLASPLPDVGAKPADVVDELVEVADPGLMAIASGRFFGWVMGGTLPAALAADWLVSAWDQNTGLRYATPAASSLEHAAGVWLLDLLDLPRNSDVGFVTGATMANFTCLSAARGAVLSAVGWDVHANGLRDAPRLHVLVGAERHDTIDLALRYLGLGTPTVVAADREGRIVVEALSAALDAVPTGEPIIVCLQAGNVHSGAFDPFADAVAVAKQRSAWVHVDGAFGLWAAASDTMRHLVGGLREADSWASDAHKTLNVPYDCGLAIVAHPAALRSAMGAHASYLISDTSGPGDPLEKVPEFSRRARGIPVWAALRSLGRSGVVELVDGLTRNARALAAGVAAIEGAVVLNDVVYTQVCVAFESDERTREVTARLIADGTAWMSGSRWHDRDVLRISVSNWSTDDEDVARSVDAVSRAAAR